MTNAGLLAQGSEGITAKGTCQVIGRDLLVGTSADPRLRNVAMSAVLQFLYEIAEASAQHASRSGATKQTAQSPGSRSPKPAHQACPKYRRARHQYCRHLCCRLWVAEPVDPRPGARQPDRPSP